MTMIEVDVDVECTECGKTLNASVTRSRSGNVTMSVEPCSKCVDAANSDGYKEGKADAEEGTA